MIFGLLSANSINMQAGCDIKRHTMLQKTCGFTSLNNLSVFIAFVLFALLLSSCKNDLAEARLVVSRANVNIEKGKEVEINYSDKGIIKIKCEGFNT